MGYLLMLQDTTLTGTSCLATGRDDSPVKCALPANSDSKVMAGAVLKRNGIQCKVRDLKWLGTSAANLDHIEAACEGGGGYVMRSPQLGSSGKLEVLSCQDAIKQGIACELSPKRSRPRLQSSADSRPTLVVVQGGAEPKWSELRIKDERASSEGNRSSGATWWSSNARTVPMDSSPSCRPQVTR